jgi:hypothetical protein
MAARPGHPVPYLQLLLPGVLVAVQRVQLPLRGEDEGKHQLQHLQVQPLVAVQQPAAALLAVRHGGGRRARHICAARRGWWCLERAVGVQGMASGGSSAARLRARLCYGGVAEAG